MKFHPKHVHFKTCHNFHKNYLMPAGSTKIDNINYVKVVEKTGYKDVKTIYKDIKIPGYV